MLNEKNSKVKRMQRKKYMFLDKNISPYLHCNRSEFHLRYYRTKKLQENYLHEQN